MQHSPHTKKVVSDKRDGDELIFPETNPLANWVQVLPSENSTYSLHDLTPTGRLLAKCAISLGEKLNCVRRVVAINRSEMPIPTRYQSFLPPALVVVTSTPPYTEVK